jgi:hypothetical protein
MAQRLLAYLLRTLPSHAQRTGDVNITFRTAQVHHGYQALLVAGRGV